MSSESALSAFPQGAHRDLALPSSIHFQGIANYYRGQTNHALAFFDKASKHATGGMKARALNGIGYIYLSRGNDNQAEIALLAAMESDPDFPLARSNYGYVLMDKGEFSKAKQVFLKNATNERLKIESRRDVVLPNLALVHLAELAGATTSAAITQYEPILSALNLQTFDGVAPDQLRLANIHRAIANRIYLSKAYYGLEIYALALLTRAHSEAAYVAARTTGDTRAANLLAALSSEIRSTKIMVSQDWLGRPKKGWFATIEQYEAAYPD